MGTLSANRGYKIPTVGGDSGGEAGTDVGGWPQQIVDTINAIDADMQTALDALVALPANACLVLDRAVTAINVESTTTETTIYTKTLSADLLTGKSLRIEMAGRVAEGVTDETVTFRFKIGAFTPVTFVVPVDENVGGSIVFNANIMNTAADVLTIAGFAIGPDPAGLASLREAMSPVLSLFGSCSCDTSEEQDIEITAQPSSAAVSYTHYMVKLVQE